MDVDGEGPGWEKKSLLNGGGGGGGGRESGLKLKNLLALCLRQRCQRKFH